MLLYDLFSLIGLIAAFLVSRALDMPKLDRQRGFEIYVAIVIGGIIGAKLPVWASYGLRPELIMSGKSVMGGILGAFLAINLYKHLSNQQGERFGGRLAIPLAVGVGFGKIGCYFNGCCGGDFIFPPQLVESAFQFAMAAALTVYYRRTKRQDMLFPIYLMSYLVMRFMIEFVRTEPKMLLGLSIYQWMGLVFLPYVVSNLYTRGTKHA